VRVPGALRTKMVASVIYLERVYGRARRSHDIRSQSGYAVSGPKFEAGTSRRRSRSLQYFWPCTYRIIYYNNVNIVHNIISQFDFKYNKIVIKFVHTCFGQWKYKDPQTLRCYIYIYIYIYKTYICYTCITYIYIYIYGDRDSSVVIATRYGLDDPGFESWWGRDFPHPLDRSWGPPSSYKMRTGFATHPHLAPRLKEG